MKTREKLEEANLTIENYKKYLNETKTSDNRMSEFNLNLEELKNELGKKRVNVEKPTFNYKLVRFQSGLSNLTSEQLFGYFLYETIRSPKTVRF